MPLNLASPGITVREVDLTVGRVDPTSNKIGGIVAPFAQGPVEFPTIVENENDLYNIFGKPYSTDKHYEHWLTASSYLAYGGSLRIVRADDDGLYNAYVGTGSSIKIKSLEHYSQLGYDENIVTDKVVIAKDPGSWCNGIRIGIIDAKADQILTIGTGVTASVGAGITQAITSILPGAGTTSPLDGYLKGIITGVGTAAGVSEGQIIVKVLSQVSSAGTETVVDYQPGGVYRFGTSAVGLGTLASGI